MADKKFLISQCRYYDGSSKTFTDPLKNTFADIEFRWVEMTAKGLPFIDLLDEYLSYGLRMFNLYDDTPATLKAFLCNRFMYHAERVDIDAFKEFYRQYSSTPIHKE